MPFKIGRRAVLKALVAVGIQGLGWFAVPVSVSARKQDLFQSSLLKNTLMALFSDKECARSVGRRYLGLHPEKASSAIPRIRRLLEQCNYDQSLIFNTLKQQRTMDFAASESVIIEGWIVARCEADLCAAFSILTDV